MESVSLVSFKFHQQMGIELCIDLTQTFIEDVQN